MECSDLTRNDGRKMLREMEIEKEVVEGKKKEKEYGHCNHLKKMEWEGAEGE